MKIKIDADDAIYISSEKAFEALKEAYEKVNKYIHEPPKRYPCVAFEAGTHEAFWDVKTVFYFYSYNFTFTDHDL